MDIGSDKLNSDFLIARPEVFYIPPSSEQERIDEIRRSNNLQEQILQELQKLNENLKTDNEKKSIPPLQPKNETSKPTARTQIRGDVFKRLKSEHPEWSQERVALESVEELEEAVTANTVRNTYRQLGWKWERGDRIR